MKQFELVIVGRGLATAPAIRCDRADLERAGVDYEDVVPTLEREGIDKFSASFVELLDRVREKSLTVGARREGSLA
jgi:transaldolase